MAERMFADMAEKDGGTYDALIAGLIKVHMYVCGEVYVLIIYDTI